MPLLEPSTGLKPCGRPDCKETDPLKFGSNKTTKDGLQVYCKSCVKVYSAAQYQKHSAVRNAANRKYKVRHRGEKPEKYILMSAQSRAKKKGVRFDITEADIVIPTHCPILGIELTSSSTGKAKASSPSLDKIIPALGYVPGNVQVISHRANTIKSSATKEEIALLHSWAQENL